MADTRQKIKDALISKGYREDPLSEGRHFVGDTPDGNLKHIFVASSKVGVWVTDKNWTEIEGSVERIPHEEFLQRLEP